MEFDYWRDYWQPRGRKAISPGDLSPWQVFTSVIRLLQNKKGVKYGKIRELGFKNITKLYDKI